MFEVQYNYGFGWKAHGSYNDKGEANRVRKMLAKGDYGVKYRIVCKK